MIINILKDQYNCGSNRGIVRESRPELLKKLNAVVNWEVSTFPIKKDVDSDLLVFDKTFLGDIPKLKAGNVFVVGSGHVIGIDSDSSLILLVTESGGLALSRICDKIELEYELKTKYKDKNTSVVFNNFDVDSIPENYEAYTVPYDLMMIFKDNFVAGRDYPHDRSFCIEAEMSSDSLLYPIKVYIRNWDIMYDKEDLDDYVDEFTKELFSWFYNNFDPIPITEVELDDSDDSEDKPLES